MKYDARACKFNMDTGCVELLLRDGRMISIDCTGVEDALDVTIAQRAELDYLIYNDPLGYADLILNGDPKEYLKKVAGSHRLAFTMSPLSRAAGTTGTSIMPQRVAGRSLSAWQAGAAIRNGAKLRWSCIRAMW